MRSEVTRIRSVYEGTRSLPFHMIIECFLPVSKSFFIWIENVLNRSFWNGQDRIPSKWDYFLWRSLEKQLRMNSLNWWTDSTHILRRSLNCWTVPPLFNVNFDSKRAASEHDTLKLIPKMAEPSMGCILGSLSLKNKKEFRKRFVLRTIGAHHWIELIELH